MHFRGCPPDKLAIVWRSKSNSRNVSETQKSCLAWRHGFFLIFSEVPDEGFVKVCPRAGILLIVDRLIWFIALGTAVTDVQRFDLGEVKSW
jgi:hypothetical protein